MAITNIVDRRKRTYRFLKVNAIVEAAWHDNSVKNSDKVKTKRGPDYKEREHIKLSQAIRWAQSFGAPVTLFLYDSDGGIYLAKRKLITRAR